jgi:hypothetical protein
MQHVFGELIVTDERSPVRILPIAQASIAFTLIEFEIRLHFIESARGEFNCFNYRTRFACAARHHHLLADLDGFQAIACRPAAPAVVPLQFADSSDYGPTAAVTRAAVDFLEHARSARSLAARAPFAIYWRIMFRKSCPTRVIPASATPSLFGVIRFSGFKVRTPSRISRSLELSLAEQTSPNRR